MPAPWHYRYIDAHEDSHLNVSYSCIQSLNDDIWPGEGNTNKNPNFVSEGLFDFSRTVEMQFGQYTYSLPDYIVEDFNFDLLQSSSALDSGTAEGAPAEDILGRSRPFGNGFDMGAYESRASAGQSILNVPAEYATIQEALDVAINDHSLLCVRDRPLDLQNRHLGTALRA